MFDHQATLHDRDVAHFIGALQAKIDSVAERAGVADEQRLSLGTMLDALPWPERRRVGLLLKGAKAQSENRALHRAVDLVSDFASDVWNSTRAHGFTLPMPEPAEANGRVPMRARN